MPTVGWIQETAIDLFLERGFSAQEKGSATKFKCRECPMEFSSIAERSQHERLHPVANPMLTIDGREVMGDNFKLTRAVGPEDIVLSCVDEIELNGDVLEHPDELLKQLCSAKKGFFDIKLSRRGIRPKRIKIDLLVASLTQLEQVDQSFLRLFGRDDFDGDTISHFISETEGCDEVIWYRDGLIRYLHGVMAKDQRAERLTTEDFAKCFNRSHQLLVQYPTALSYSLSQLIKFSFNDFSDIHGRSSISRLDDALMLFRGNTISTNAGDQNVILKLPTDHITSRILNDYVTHFSRYTLESLELAIDQINTSKLVNQDRQKLNYLRYLKATEEGNLKAQRNYGTKLKYSEVFNVTVPESEASDV